MYMVGGFLLMSSSAVYCNSYSMSHFTIVRPVLKKAQNIERHDQWVKETGNMNAFRDIQGKQLQEMNEG